MGERIRVGLVGMGFGANFAPIFRDQRIGRLLDAVVGKTDGLLLAEQIAEAERLDQIGISAEVIDPRTLVPLDKYLILNSVRKTGRLVVVEEDNKTGGWAGEVVASVVGSPAFDYVDAPVRRLAGKDVPIPYNRGLEASAVPQEADIEREIRALVGGAY